MKYRCLAPLILVLLGACAAGAICTDGIQDGDETDSDCGGSCGPCQAGLACSAAADCSSGLCQGGRCGADCQGGSCAPPPDPSCTDGAVNGGESDVDCGGGCAPCAVGRQCQEDADCATAACYTGRCIFAPKIVGVDPAFGPSFGGISVTLSGTGFSQRPGVVALFDGRPVASALLDQSQLITVTLPANPGKVGAVDVVVRNPDGHVGTLGGGFTYERWPEFTSVNYATSANSAAVLTADLNGDGKLDLACANQADPGSMSVLLGNGDGTFQAATKYPTGTRWTGSIAAADLNGDGKLDLAVTNIGFAALTTRYISVFINNGGGTFKAGVKYPADRDPGAIALGDINGDSKIDIVATNRSSGNVSVLLGNGDGTFQATVNLPVAAAQPYGVALADLSGDGKLDLAVANNSDGGVLVQLGNGDGSFQAATSYPTGNVTWQVVAKDVDGDLVLDLVASNFSDATVSVLRGKGDGTFAPASTYRSGSLPIGLAVADLNGDGVLDLATANNTFGGTVSVLLGRAGTGFAATSAPAVGTSPRDVATGDFNGDGKADLAVANTSGSISVLLNATR